MKSDYNCFICILWVLANGLTSCYAQKNISRQADQLINDSIIRHAHIGISIYEPASGKYLFTHDAEKYFVPASNTKLFSLFAGLTILGDSIPALKIYELEDKVVIEGMGDPTLLHPDYPKQPVLEFLGKVTKPIFYINPWQENAWGHGWSWDDFSDDYMAERSLLPVYGNVIRFKGNSQQHYFPRLKDSLAGFIYSGNQFISRVKRDRYSNQYIIEANGKSAVALEVPFISSPALNMQLLSDTLHKSIRLLMDTSEIRKQPYHILYSRPIDSMYTPMMHRSDNFFAEQVLLMSSNVRLGYMADKAIIENLLNNELKNLPQPPQWVDGSGLSRYNLFSPNDMIYVLDALRKNFGMPRLKQTLATGGTGTLKYYYRNATDSIFAKTGTLSNHVSLSGYIISRKEKLLLFSVMVNLYNSGATPVRRQVESFLEKIRMEN
ncbi:MAG: D-alanyl-D-alanine carboxypeptidase [Ferruginibacter sp.]